MSIITNISQVTSTYELPDKTTKQNNVSSNESSTVNMTTSFIKTHASAKDYGEPKEEIEQTITLTNNSEFAINDLQLDEMINDGAHFKEGSVFVDDIAQADYDVVTGINLGTLNAGTTKTIKYTLVIDDEPTEDSIDVYSSITYSVNEAIDLNEETNISTIEVSKNVIVITKTSDKSAVIKGDTIKFQNVVENKGNVTNTEVQFTDPIPSGTSFVPGSVYIDGVQQGGSNPAVGFKINDLAPGDKITITFEVTVD